MYVREMEGKFLLAIALASKPFREVSVFFRLERERESWERLYGSSDQTLNFRRNWRCTLTCCRQGSE